ncbi:fibronectin [Notolabrus celidotus]|uniref:fibronectin n=1 Tax=Notolabrus celidotus TaxID=1203425 RepID=UPI0014906FB7|nr:fibronectin [Notolabrus celidotus]
MGKLFLKDKGCFLIFCALMVSYSATEREYFHQWMNRTWDEARNHCQVCFKDLVTLTPENIQTIVLKFPSESWVGLRKNFYSCSNLTSNTTIHGSSNTTISGSSNTTIHGTSYSTSNSTSSIRMPWSSWANGDPLTFQNWYPGWPHFKSSPPKTDCCSCSCTCPATSNPSMTTQRVTTAAPFTDFSTQDVTNFSTFTEDGMENQTEKMTHFIDPITMTTRTNLPIEAECMKSPMTTPVVPEIDENYIEDSCVAMLSFGAWIEKDCSELLPFICYEDRFFGQANVTNVTSSSAVLAWLPVPGDISDYRVEAKDEKGHMDNLTNLTFHPENLTHLTLDLENLTAGSHYSVQVFAVKCQRDLHPQEVDFYTTPNKVENLIASNVTETSISLSWNKPAGGVDFYLIEQQGVKDRSTWSEEASINQHTKPGKVSDLTASDNTNISLQLTWKPPKGLRLTFSVKAVPSDSNESPVFTTDTTVKVKSLPTGSKITLSVRVLINDSGDNILEGEEVTIHSYTAPGPISNLTLEPQSNSLSAQWVPPVGNFSSYSVELQLNGNIVSAKDNLTKSSESFEGLKAATKYKVIVWAVSGNLRSPPMEGFESTNPLPPTNLTVTHADKTKITFQWKAPVNTSSVLYSVKISSSFWGHSFNKTINQTNYTFEGLKSGTKYQFEVQTVAGRKSSNSVTLSHFTEADIREISVSMLCSSTEPLLCGKEDTKKSVLSQLQAHLGRELGNDVFWSLVGLKT